MGKNRVSIVVLGDPGPVKYQLLGRGDLQVFWTHRIEEARTILAEEAPKLLLVSPDAGIEHSWLLVDLLNQHVGVPCALLVAATAPLIEPGLAARAVAIVPIDQGDSILSLVASYTGLTFARDARVPLEALARVVIKSEEHVSETWNIGASGVAIRKFPKVPLGTDVRITIVLAEATIDANARVVRYSLDGQTAGLAFVDLPPVMEKRIRALVEREIKRLASPPLEFEHLFGEVKGEAPPDALATNDLAPMLEYAADGESTDLEIALLRAILVGEPGSAADVQLWLTHVANELTAIEFDAAVGLKVPEWAIDALKMRIRLGRAKGQGKLPSGLGNDAYRMFIRLAGYATHVSGSIGGEIARIRAAILRDLLSSRRGWRSGSVPQELPDAEVACEAPWSTV